MSKKLIFSKLLKTLHFSDEMRFLEIFISTLMWHIYLAIRRLISVNVKLQTVSREISHCNCKLALLRRNAWLQYRFNDAKDGRKRRETKQERKKNYPNRNRSFIDIESREKKNEKKNNNNNENAKRNWLRALSYTN